MTEHLDPLFPLLVVDTACPTTTIGLGRADHDWAWASEQAETGVALFTCLEQVLNKTGIDLASVRTLAFCEGPGSMLGIRTAAMAIRTWKASSALRETRLMVYSSLEVAAAGLRQSGLKAIHTTAIDARRQSWHCLTSDPATPSNPGIERIPHAEIDKLPGQVFLPEGFPVWNPRPPNWIDCPYSPGILESKPIREAILREVAQPDAYQPEPPTYQKWVPTISRAPDPSPSLKETRP